MKVVFLDFDGVICTDKVFMAHGKSDPKGPMDMLDEYAVTLLSKFCQQYGWSIVVSSTWRRFFTDDQLRDKLYSSGLDRSVEVLGSIGMKMSGEPRAMLISDWVEDHNPEDWIVIDDVDYYGFNKEPFSNRFCRIRNKYDGFGYLDYKWMHEYVSGGSESDYSANSLMRELFR